MRLRRFERRCTSVQHSFILGLTFVTVVAVIISARFS
jgi:hypothetical protein